MKYGLFLLFAAFALAGPVPALAQEVTEPISIGDETYFGVRSVPGFNITGTYLYEEKGEPSITLNADGTGAFAVHGRAPKPITWWVMSDADGTPKTNKGAAGQVHTIIYQNADGKFDMLDLQIAYGERIMIILGERIKRY